MLQLATLIKHHSTFRPDQVAIVIEQERLSWREFEARVGRCARLVSSLGVRKGERVATVLSNCRELLEIYWAVPSLGAVLVPLSPLLMASGLASLLRAGHRVRLVGASHRTCRPEVADSAVPAAVRRVGPVILVEGRGILEATHVAVENGLAVSLVELNVVIGHQE